MASLVAAAGMPVKKVRLLFQAVKPVAGGRVDEDVVDRAIVVDGLGGGDPIGGAQIVVLLQVPAGGGRGPGDQHGVSVGEGDA